MSGDFKVGEYIEFKKPIVAMQTLGGFYRRKEKLWYPQRLMVATQEGIYEIIPTDLTVPILPSRIRKTKKEKR
jgi:hypothetical protein